MSNPHFKPRPPISGLLIDISGTLHIGSTPTSNSVNAFNRLRESGIPFRLCSNSSKESSASLVGRLEKMGFDISPKNGQRDNGTTKRVAGPRLVWTSLGAVAEAIKSMNLSRPYFLLSESARDEVLAQLSEGYENSDGSVSELASTGTDYAYDSVVVGLAPASFDYTHLNVAFRILKGEQAGMKTATLDYSRSAPLIATHRAKYIQTEDGLSLGPGPFVAALENATGTTAHIVGKPTKEFFQMVVDDFSAEEISGASKAEAGANHTTPEGSRTFQSRPSKLRKGRIAIIGDDVEADLGGGALEHGFWRILVKTGKYRLGDEKRPGVVPPDEIHESFSSFVDSLLQT